jgi:5-methylcytosine-specific restriction protein A
MPRMPTKVFGPKIEVKKNWLRNPEDAKIYESTRWRKLRKAYMQRNPVCTQCTQPAKFLDHIKPISQGGDIWNLDNLQGLCPSCNGKKTNSQKLK